MQSSQQTMNSKNCWLLRTIERRILTTAHEFSGKRLQEAKQRLEEIESTNNEEKSPVNSCEQVEEKMSNVALE